MLGSIGMMNSFKAIVAGAVLATVAATGSYATTTNATAGLTQPRGENSFDVIFQWNDTPASAEIRIDTVGFDFNITLGSYTTDGGLPVVGQQTGYYVDRIENGVATRLTSDTNLCSDAAWSAAGSCNLVNGTTGVGTTLLAGLSAGTYQFGVFDSQNPQRGRLVLSVDKVAAIPLPAGGVLLLGALGGFAALRRRKQAT